MTILKTDAQIARDERNKLAIEVYRQVNATCVGSKRQKCMEASRRLSANYGQEVHFFTIYKLIKDL
jgi:hypothetical protein